MTEHTHNWGPCECAGTLKASHPDHPSEPHWACLDDLCPAVGTPCPFWTPIGSANAEPLGLPGDTIARCIRMAHPDGDHVALVASVLEPEPGTSCVKWIAWPVREAAPHDHD